MCKNNRKIISNILFFIFSVAIVFFFVFVINIIRIDGESMEPTLKNNSFILTLRNTNNISYDDIIVFTKDDMKCIKRVVAIEGDIVKLKEGSIWINDIKLSNYTYSGKSKTYVIKKDEFFVLGDNPKKSVDSREFGVINIDSVKSVKIGE